VTAYKTRPGWRYPPGAKVDEGGVNFSVFSRHATSVELRLYESAQSPAPFQVVSLDPEKNRTFFFWHVYAEGLRPGVFYAWRADGPGNTKETGFRFDKDKDLLDPWARAVSDSIWDRQYASVPGDNAMCSMRAIVVEEDYDWEGDEPVRHRPEEAVIYELHVGGFTSHPSSGVLRAGTFSGLVEKIPYLKELGITDIELMPVMAFDAQEVPENAASRGLSNYWGYSTHSFFSPHPRYCAACDEGVHLREFRDMVKALHRAGIGIILDVVFNHTAEAGVDGPTIHFKGLANEVFYHLDPRDRRLYRDYTGCGNTVNCNHPLVSSFPPIIAEAWDAGGLYQVGGFPGFRWAEWNGRYRDVIRRFVRGDPGLVSEVATRLSGSSDLYQHQGRLPINSVNFVTCHDGFTLHDLVSYNEKHNEANGEGNRDGMNENLSWNCGEEGETDDPSVQALRERQARNFLAILLLSHGVPMLLAGDEVLRTQRGNNNAYCQDNELSWFDWSLLEKNKDMLRFVSHMIAFRRRHPCLMRTHFLRGIAEEVRSLPDVTWHGLALGQPLWGDPSARVLAYTLAAVGPGEEDLHIVLNMSESCLDSPVPKVDGRRWYLAVDTSQPAPDDIYAPESQPAVGCDRYPAQPRSVLVFEGR